jgi:hypothetical protein
MDGKSAPCTRTRAAIEFSSFKNAIGIEATTNVTMSEAYRRLTPLSKSYKAKSHEDKTGLADQLGRDAETKKRLGGRNVVGRRRRVSVHD